MKLTIRGVKQERPTLSEKAEKAWEYFEFEGKPNGGRRTDGWRAVHLPSGQWLTMDEAGSWDSLAVWDTDAELSAWLETVADVIAGE